MWPRCATGTPTLPTSPAASGVVGVVAGLGGQVEGDRQAGLALGEVGPVQLVGRHGGGVARVGPHHPRLRAFGHVSPLSVALSTVVVEAGARLATQLPGAHHAPQQGHRREVGVGELRVERVEDRE